MWSELKSSSPNGGEGDEEEEEEEAEPLEGRRNWGETQHYCPVSLCLDDLMRPGSAEFAAKYRGHVYYIANAEYQEKFIANPLAYLPKNGIAKVGDYPMAVHHHFSFQLCGKLAVCLIGEVMLTFFEA